MIGTAAIVRAAIVTGAGQGFGLALTAALAGRGTPMIACSRDAAREHRRGERAPGAGPPPSAAPW